MRTKKAAINAVIGVMTYIIIMLSNLITRRVLLQVVGLGMVGVEGVFKNFISMLALAELGLGTGLIYKLYKPLADGDTAAIKHILNFYKRAYQLIAAVIFAAGLVFSLFIHHFIQPEEGQAPLPPVYLGILFMLFVLDVIASYLFANRKALIVADQRNFVVNLNDTGIQFLTMVLQVLLLKITQQYMPATYSFMIYAAVKIVCRLAGACMIARKFRKLYPEVAASRDKAVINGEERQSLMRNIGAMLCHKIGGYSVTATGSIIISWLVNVVQAGIYANYQLIVNTVTQLIMQIFNGITASFGNLIATESHETVYDRFNTLYFINYLIYSFCTVSIFVLAQPFVSLMFGKESLFPIETLALLTVYFYVFGMRRVILMSKDSAGLYRPDRYLTLLEAGINLILSFLLVNVLGVNGVILANLLSILLVPMWSQPYIVYKNILHHGLKSYYLRYILYLGIAAVSMCLTVWLASLVTVANPILSLFLKAMLCLVIPNGINCLLFWRTKEFRYVKELGTQFARQLLKRGKRA